jgi:N-dimethylarginine dimethylaminohydrolase/methylmalonyl-CoA mutase cobalamin-binding subunit
MCRPAGPAAAPPVTTGTGSGQPVDQRLAVLQWQRIHDLLTELGHSVDIIEPRPGMPGTMFASRTAAVRDGRVLAARFHGDEPAAATPVYPDWFARHGFEARQARWAHEGQGDFLAVGGWLLAGSGFGTDRRAHAETEEYFGCPVISLTLVNQACRHLDTALAALDEQTIMYYPAAFSPGSQALLGQLFPGAIIASSQDAVCFGLNAVSDGLHVLLPAGAVGLTAQLRDRGWETIDVDASELLRAGGGVKSCVLELPGTRPREPAQALARTAAVAARPAPPGAGLTVVVTSVASDSHTWNLVYLQLALEELGHRVVNLGACVPEELLVSECLRVRPDLVVVSTVNGHGFHDGMRVIGCIRGCPDLAATPVVIGGKLGITGPAGRAGRDQLRAAGFDAVFEEGAGMTALASLAEHLTVSVGT